VKKETTSVHHFALVGVMLIAGLVVNESYGQSFEVASVKPVPSGTGAPSIAVSQGGRLTAENVTLRRLIRWAYDVQDFQVAGGPERFNQPIYEVIAKAAVDAKAEQLARMVQAFTRSE